MASKAKSLDLASKIELLQYRNRYEKGTGLSEEYSIIWYMRKKCELLRRPVFYVKTSDPIGVLKGEPFIGIECYLKNELDLDYYDILLELNGSSRMNYPYYLHGNIHISVSFIDANNRIRNTHNKIIRRIDQPTTEISFAKFIKEADLFDENNHFWSNEQLTIYCKIYDSKERSAIDKILIDDSPTDCRQKVLDKFEELLQNGKFSDMKFIIGSKELKVHKYILSAQSPVFEAMFAHDTQEQTNNSAEIIDISYETMKEVLRFVYSAKVNNIKKMAKDIFIAADKYEIDALKILCEKELIESLSVENVCDMLRLIDRYDSENLKKSVLNFISDNKKIVNNTNDFHKTLNTLQINLLRELIKILMSSK